MKILCICLSAGIQKTADFATFRTQSVNRARTYRTDASGKAVNTARVLNQLEKNSSLLICPAGIQNEAEFRALCQKDALCVKTVPITGRTRECLTLLDAEQRNTTEVILTEPGTDADYHTAEKRILNLVSKEVRDADAAVLAGSAPAYFSRNLLSSIAKTVCSAKKLLLADYCGEPLNATLMECTPAFIKINEEEFRKTFCGNAADSGNAAECGTTAKCSGDEQALKDKIMEESRRTGGAVIVTRGTLPTYAAQDGVFYECPAERVSAVNTTACGDSFNAGFLYEYIKSGDFAAALQKGTWCAARNAESVAPGDITGARF